MAIRVAILGPGRVGMALGRRLRESGVDVLGYLGRSDASAQRACEFVGGGRPLTFADLSSAHVVLFAVSDPALREVVANAVAAAEPRSCSLWIHTSARFDLSVFEPLERKGVRIGALHPVAPFPDAEAGYRGLAGKPAALIADPRARRLLATLVQKLSMVPLWCQPGGSRVLYHAACALAANGLTALRAAVDAAFTASGCLADADAAIAADALMRAALDACRDLGPTAALSGPVVRGDAETLRLHRAALRASAPEVESVYRAVMGAAVSLSHARGLSVDAERSVRSALEGEV